MITAKAQTLHEALKNKDFETLAQLYVERMAMKAVKADLAEAVPCTVNTGACKGGLCMLHQDCRRNDRHECAECYDVPRPSSV
jgi:hypothetical protein